MGRSTHSGTRIVVGMSGGVDSAVAALLLCRDGWDVHGLFMSNWDEDDAYCTSARDFQDARAVCRELGIPLHRVSFAQEYRESVFSYFLAEHRAGRTPNPDVLCNREIKFGVCLSHARRLGAQSFATGHYARRGSSATGATLLKGRDAAKAQSYFLHASARGQLREAHRRAAVAGGGSGRGGGVLSPQPSITAAVETRGPTRGPRRCRRREWPTRVTPRWRRGGESAARRRWRARGRARRPPP